LRFLARLFGTLALALAAGVILLAPWVFGAWEMWGFWPFASALFAATACLGLHLLCAPAAPAGAAASAWAPLRRGLGLLAAALPFLAYAFVRFRQAPVYLLAERAFLLQLTPVLLALILLITARGRTRLVVFGWIAADLFLLGAYGIINHYVTRDRFVLWVPGFPQYYKDHRATGSYFCPDHFAGVMELAVCAGIALLCHGGKARFRAAGALLSALGACGIILSKSRGGGLTLMVIGLAALIWGLAHLPPAVRRWWRVSAATALLGAVLLVGVVARNYVERYLHYFGWHEAQGRPPREALAASLRVLSERDRPTMAAAALRAWRTHPWVGIGPGMHPVLWPHFAPSPDGDPATGRWPSRPNNFYTANAVHNDWIQLLEECGAIGLALFAVPFVLVAGTLVRLVRAAGDRMAAHDDGRAWRPTALLALAAVLALAGMAFHSLGDFNLQMPATTWLLASLLALPLAAP
jgi:O-antigen ligase